MKQLLEFLPLIIFFIVYQMSGTTLSVGDSEYTFDGIYTATIALILTTILQVIIVKLVWGSVEKRLLGVAGAVIIFGGATVLLKDPVFIFWKPTVFNWALAGVSVVWHVMRGKCLFEDLLPDEIEMPKHIWKRVTVASTLHFFIVGAVNLYVAYNFSMDAWVSFKLWSAVLFTLIWAVVIGVIMGPHLKETDSSDDNETTKTF
ncbi:MAG: inner membrane-spanning protein YciB [Luminiphilus sp.]|jgi:intracellular septation protein|nr:septation protein IspZ [Luminiphilus sp.]